MSIYISTNSNHILTYTGTTCATLYVTQPYGLLYFARFFFRTDNFHIIRFCFEFMHRLFLLFSPVNRVFSIIIFPSFLRVSPSPQLQFGVFYMLHLSHWCFHFIHFLVTSFLYTPFAFQNAVFPGRHHY